MSRITPTSRRTFVTYCAVQLLTVCAATHAQGIPEGDVAAHLKADGSVDAVIALFKQSGNKVPEPDQKILQQTVLAALSNLQSMMAPGVPISGVNFTALAIDGETKTSLEVRFRQVFFRAQPQFLYCTSLAVAGREFKRTALIDGQFYVLPDVLSK